MSKQPIAFNRLSRLSVVGGFMDGVRIEFDPHLNCLIGARGTGKTTALEFIRFALDIMPDDATARRRVESFVERNLSFGRIELGIETKDGLPYIVTRAAGEPPIVLTEDRKPTEITLKAGSFFKADIFSQNEVESIADRSLSQLELIDNFAADDIAGLNAQLKQIGVELTGNAGAIEPLQDRIAALNEEIATLPIIEEKLKGLSPTDSNDADEINAAHAQKSLRDRERRAMDELTQFLADYHRNLGSLSGQLRDETRRRLAADVLAGTNGAVLGEVLQSLSECAGEVDALIRQAREIVAVAQSRLNADKGSLATVHAAQEMAFRATIEKHQAAMGQSAERSRLEKTRNDLLAKRRERNEAVTRLDKVSTDRAGLLQKLSDLRDAKFKVRKVVADRINLALSPTIRVTILQAGNPHHYLQLLEDALQGARIKHGLVAQKIVNAMWPANLVNIVKSQKPDQLVTNAELNDEQAEKVVDALSNSRCLHALEIVELIDKPIIELNDSGTYKDSQSLSTGQKCTTILPILLMESEKPLLVDQPEDNLDNRFISQTIVESLRTVKPKRQIIFVTHNPNIPVLGDAEKVFVLESNGMSARLTKEGTVDGCKGEIVTLLEGGEDAFKQRKERYKF